MGISINRIINFVAKTEGATVRASLGRKQLNQVTAEMGQKGKLIFDKTFAQLKDPHLDVAYKASERGYTVGAVTIRDGKKVVGNGALSVTGLGTEQSVVKYRLNIGENGKAVQSCGFLDNTKPLSLDDVTMNILHKHGIITASERYGDAMGHIAKINANELAKMGDDIIGRPIATKGYEAIMKKINGLVGDFQKKGKDLLAGKEVGAKANPIKEEFVKLKEFDKTKFEKFTKGFNKKASKPIKVSNTEVEEMLKRGELKDFVKVPSGKLVPKNEFKTKMEEYFRLCTKNMERKIEMGDTKGAEKISAELKNLSEQIKGLNVEIKNDWTKYLGEAFKV